MKVKVEFEAEVEQMAGKNCLVMVPKVEGVLQQRIWFPGSACTPILPDFVDGDLVEHVPSGARASVTRYNDGTIVDFSGGDAEILVSISVEGMYNRGRSVARWKAADCRIVRKAWETE